MVVVLANVTWYLAALDAMLYDHYRGSSYFLAVGVGCDPLECSLVGRTE